MSTIKHPISFYMLMVILVLTALLTVALHSLLAWLAVINLLLIILFRCVCHAEIDGRIKWVFAKLEWVKSSLK